MGAGGIFTKILRHLVKRQEIRPYFKIRFRWWKPFDIDRFAGEVNDRYEISYMGVKGEKGRIEIHREGRREIRVKADTLYAFLSAYKAVLFQKEVAPLTERDVELKETLLKQFPYNRYTPIL